MYGQNLSIITLGSICVNLKSKLNVSAMLLVCEYIQYPYERAIRTYSKETTRLIQSNTPQRYA